MLNKIAVWGSRMIARNLLWAGLAVMMACAAPSQAADLSLYMGGVIPGSINYQNVKTSLDNSPILGFRLGTNFVPMLGMEHTLAFSYDYLFPESIEAVKQAKGFVYNSDLIVNLPVGNIVPYLTAGAGLIHQYGNVNMPVGTKLAFNYGGGVKFPHLMGPMGLRFDVRGYNAGVFSNKLNMFEISGGVLLSLSK